MILLLACVLTRGALPVDAQTVTVDMIEVQEYTDEERGGLHYTQVIFWEWLPDYSRHAVMNWVLAESRLEDPRPVREGKWYVCRLRSKSGEPLKIRSRRMIQTRLPYDRERLDKLLTPEKHRLTIGIRR